MSAAGTTPDPIQQQSGSIGGHISWANTTDRTARTARTAPARAALEQTFLDQAEGDPVRAAHFRAAHYKRLALKSAQARRKTKVLTETVESAETKLHEVGGPDAA